MDLRDKTALVTGGGTGIGVAIARCLAAQGARVCVSGRRQGPLDALLAALPAGRAAACAGDVSLVEDAEAMVEAAAELGGGQLDIVVNNAAQPINGTVESVPLGDWQRALDVNLTGAMLVTRAAVPRLRAAGGGAIVNVASVAALTVTPGIAPYATAKAALVALSRQCAVDLAPDGIRVNAICPGWVRTEMSELQMDGLGARIGADREAAFVAATRHQPLPRPADPDEVGRVVAFLCGDGASFITGAVLAVDGGSSVVSPLAELFTHPPVDHER